MIFTTQPESQRNARAFGASLIVHVAGVVLLAAFGSRVLSAPTHKAHVVLLAPVFRSAPPPTRIPQPLRAVPKLLVLPPPIRHLAVRTPLLVEPPTIRPAEAPARVPVPQTQPPLPAEQPRQIQVVTGTFEPRPSPAPAPPAAVRAQATGTFEMAAARTDPSTPSPRLAMSSVGGFTSAGAATAGQNERAVARSAGFGEAAAPLNSPSVPVRSVASAGFGSTGGAIASTAQPANVKAAGFADAARAVPTQMPRALPGPLSSTPVEITHKPRPAYTDEARRLQIEGEVLVEATFSASGDVRVLRIVSGLGHGLDESAILAARGIRFRPATRNATPMDATATVRITFQLAY
jgi:TonB family protein